MTAPCPTEAEGFNNELVAEGRATQTKNEIAAAGVFPAGRLAAAGLGICGDEATDRNVTVRWTRTPS